MSLVPLLHERSQFFGVGTPVRGARGKVPHLHHTPGSVVLQVPVVTRTGEGLERRLPRPLCLGSEVRLTRPERRLRRVVVCNEDGVESSVCLQCVTGGAEEDRLRSIADDSSGFVHPRVVFYKGKR